MAYLALVFFSVPLAPASAQSTDRASLDHRIVVVGQGTVHAPADEMQIEVRLVPRPGSTNVDEVGRSIADIMRRNGIPDAQWRLPMIGFLSPASQGAIVGSIRKPTRETLEAMARRIVQAVPDSITSSVQNVNVTTALRLDDCRGWEARAEEAAIADARRRAERLASATRLSLGNVMGASATQVFTPGCGNAAIRAGGPEGPFGAYGPLDVDVNESVTVTFATR
ncbi:MAG: SIMPL domain-containing protein [Candidatus Eremiobacteraeota bacterium]|nr:SIMPL domain-containing protein [Candidatus Eremiobacteraeota bacterium]